MEASWTFYHKCWMYVLYQKNIIDHYVALERTSPGHRGRLRCLPLLMSEAMDAVYGDEIMATARPS
jgi:hypothetical protein